MFRFTGFRSAGSLAAGLFIGATLSAGLPVTGAHAQQAEPVRGGTLIYADQAFINSWLLAAGSWYHNATILHSIVDRLVYLDPATQQVVPWLASSFEVSPDAKTFTFEIRDGVTFSDGSPLTPELVAKNLDRLGRGNKELGISRHPYFDGYQSTSVDGRKVTIHLERPNRYLLTALTQVQAGIVSEAALSKTQAEQAEPQNLIASGPFVFESQIPGQQVTIVRREGYAWPPATASNKGEAYLDKVVIRTIAEPSLRAGAVQSGQVHIAKGIQPTDEAGLKDAGFVIYPRKSTLNISDQFSLRPDNPKLADQRVRKALSISIDRAALVEAALSDSYPATTTLLVEGVPHRVAFDKELTQDLAEANRLLDEAGWTRGPDGIRQKDGQRLELTATASSQSAAVIPAIDYLGQQWRQDIGVLLVNRAGDDVLFSGRGSNSPDIELKLFRPEVTAGLGKIFGADELAIAAGRAPNVSSLYSDPELNALFAKDLESTDPDEQAKIVADILRKLIVEKVYTIPLYEPSQVLGGAKKLHIGFNTYTSPIFQSTWIEP